MTNHCPDSNADPGRRNAWGVDLNRNYRVGSGFDGYDGASTQLHRRHVPGPGEAVRARDQERDLARRAEPQHQVLHVRALQRRPAVLAAGRVHRQRPHHHAAPADGPRGVLLAVGRPDPVAGARAPPDGRHAGERRRLRPTSCTRPRATCARTCTSTTAIFAFGWEVGGSVYNPATGNFQGGSFQPAWVGNPHLVSGHSETMEYTNGVMEMFRIAATSAGTRPPRRPR